MTLSQAIAAAHAGEREGFVHLCEHTMPIAWLTAAVLGCSNIGTAVYQVYMRAEKSIVSLHSPSDLRVWLGHSMYPVLQETAAEHGIMISGLPEEADQAYQIIAALPCEQRIALLTMCADGCSAAQAAELLDRPDIEVKRAVRAARQLTAAEMKKQGSTANCNTGWLIAQFDCMKQTLDAQTAPERARILDCIRQNIPYEAQETQNAWVETEQKETMTDALKTEEKEKNGFFSKLFRSRRFG